MGYLEHKRINNDLLLVLVGWGMVGVAVVLMAISQNREPLVTALNADLAMRGMACFTYGFIDIAVLKHRLSKKQLIKAG